MFVSFDINTFLMWVFISTFIPGAILSLAIFRKSSFLFIEKLFLGGALGIIILPLFPFFAYFLLGITFNYTLVLVSVTLLYIVAIALAIKQKLYEDVLNFKLPEKIEIPKNPLQSVGLVVTITLLLFSFLSFSMRASSYSPIYMELDPYYYTYISQQILTNGYNPFNDQTGWYPDVQVSHRESPSVSYLNAIYYSLYTNGASYDNLLLALTASIYPPLISIFYVFAIYLLVLVFGKREWALMAAGLAAFLPILIAKMASGVQEIGPYTFFILPFFYALYAFSIKEKKMSFYVIAILALAAVCLGSNSLPIVVAASFIFTILTSIFLYLFNQKQELKNFAYINALIYFFGGILGKISIDFFRYGYLSYGSLINILLPLIFPYLLYLLKDRYAQLKNTHFLGGLIIISLIILYSPLGAPIKSFAVQYISNADYTTALSRTIAEQTLAGGDLSNELGALAATSSEASMQNLLLPLKLIFTQGDFVDTLAKILSAVFTILLIPFSIAVNLSLTFVVGLMHFFLGAKITYLDKTVSFLFFWVLLFWAVVVYAFWKPILAAYEFLKKIINPNSKNDNEHTSTFDFFLPMMAIFFFAITMPSFLIGIIKAKLLTYAAFTAVLVAGFIFVVIGHYIENLKKGIKIRSILLALSIYLTIALIGCIFAAPDKSLFAFILLILAIAAYQYLKNENEIDKNKLYNYLLSIAIIVVVCQFFYGGLAFSLTVTSFSTLYQNNPVALSQKFSHLCTVSHDIDVCNAASDPMGYASKGTTYQYNNKLCLLSVLSDPTIEPPNWELRGAYFRCQTLSSYWIESMEWIRTNTELDARITSWWDYGHWINFFGQRNTVLRNEHASPQMIGGVAAAYLHGSSEDLKTFMKNHDSKYALFDMELLSSGNSFGGKYGALNYLGCDFINETNVNFSPGQSQCEADHTWENIFISGQKCTISSINNQSGVIGYKFFAGGNYLPYYPDFCSSPKTQNDQLACTQQIKAVPTYCIGQATLADGKAVTTTYYYNETYPNGDLKLNKAFLQYPFQIPTSHVGQTTMVTLIYTEDKVWFENGEIKSGYEDAKGKFYASNLYHALVLNNLPGFKQVYSTAEGMVKIYKLADQ